MEKQNELNQFFKGKTVMVTGGLGSIGAAIIKELSKYEVKGIKAIDNRETEIYYKLENREDPDVNFIFADVRDKESIKKAFKGVDIVFHAAAMKHVIICERHPFEAVKTNIVGTQNVIESCLENNVGKMVLISTDKAVNPNSVMGSTKLAAERMVSAMHSSGMQNTTQFGAVRFGNVLYSRGSVLEVWQNQIQTGNKKITVTNPEMTRFIMGIPQSVELIFSAARNIKNSEIFILKMPSCKIKTLAEAYLEINNLPSDNYTLINPNEGEKTHEELVSSKESSSIMENDDFFVILPTYMRDISAEQYRQLGFKEYKGGEFSSDAASVLLDKESIKEILKKYAGQN
jgi:FlaA1/EpsC-like NDP-sugar epimerase